MSPLRRRRSVFALAGSAFFLLAGSAAALSPSGIVAKLNSERAALGIPPVTLNASRTAACKAHNSYMRRNHALGHFETPGASGYTRAGDRAARMSVLAARSNWARHNPWRNAPIHLAQVYNPGLRATGASDYAGYSCLFTYPNTRRNEGDRVWTLPADGGNVARAQTAFEGPSPPQTKVGIRNGAKTGPYLFVWSAGPSSSLLAPITRLLSGTLIGPNGPVDTKLIDSARVGYLANRGNGWLLPVKPLAANATYTATVIFAPSVGLRRVTHSWTFQTTSASLTG